VRGFTQDDAHIFATPETVEAEAGACVDLALLILKTFGFDRFEVELSTWDPADPVKYSGEASQWELAERSLESALRARGIPFKRMVGEAAFYGPKIDIKLVDALGRPWQLTTVQFDFFLPERFGLEYMGADGQTHQPLMVHRALLGSVERFFGVLIEHYVGAFPVWLAPVQTVVLPISDRHSAYAQEVAGELRRAGIRVRVDDRNEKLNARIRDAQLQKIPYMLVVGDREAQARAVAVRRRDTGDAGSRPLAEFKDEVRHLIDTRASKW
jgi:threonyl-tRNA synthetase